jgi:polyisoprenoid-binding protein YceI
MNKLLLSGIFALLIGISPAFSADVYKLDPAHSNVGFTVRHMMISTITGQFDKIEGTVAYDPNDLANSKVNITIDASSVDTHNEKRDGHLKTADFLDVATFPAITFVSKKVTPTQIVGDLTLHGVTKEVTIPVTFSGPVATMGKTQAIGVEGSFILNRQDYGVKWNKDLDKGGVTVSNDVNVKFSIEADK